MRDGTYGAHASGKKIYNCQQCYPLVFSHGDSLMDEASAFDLQTASMAVCKSSINYVLELYVYLGTAHESLTWKATIFVDKLTEYLASKDQNLNRISRHSSP